jgi:hypothetical protein
MDTPSYFCTRGGGGGGGDDDDDGVDTNTAQESVSENIKSPATERLGFYEFRQHKPRFD